MKIHNHRISFLSILCPLLFFGCHFMFLGAMFELQIALMNHSVVDLANFKWLPMFASDL